MKLKHQDFVHIMKGTPKPIAWFWCETCLCPTDHEMRLGRWWDWTCRGCKNRNIISL